MQLLTLSLLGPIAYLTILVGSMATFSHLYRTRQVNKKLRLAPYFPPHTTRNVYLSLLHLQDTEREKETKVPESVLRAALFARACEDIKRIMEIRLRKPALNALLQRGVVGDEIFQRLQRAEQELELELKDVMAEANALSASGGQGQGTWGTTIFQSANEFVQNAMLREKLEGIKGGLKGEKERWEGTREGARRELLGSEVKSANVVQQQQQQQQQPVPAPVPVSAPVEQSTTIPKAATVSSDEDGVIVETPAAEVVTPGAGGGGGGGKNKKKKGKK